MQAKRFLYPSSRKREAFTLRGLSRLTQITSPGCQPTALSLDPPTLIRTPLSHLWVWDTETSALAMTCLDAPSSEPAAPSHAPSRQGTGQP
jgi:hypothetical protein